MDTEENALDYEKIIDFLEKENGDTDAVSRFKASRSSARCGLHVSVSGWQKINGVLLMWPTSTQAEDYEVYLTATTERALRELLLGFPRQNSGLFHLPEKWMDNALREVLVGEFTESESGRFYRGVKRGSAGKAEPRTVSKRKDAVASQFRKLTSLKGKLEHGQFVIEGERIVARAVTDGMPVETILYTAGFVGTTAGKSLLTKAHAENLAYYQVSDGVMGSITTTRPVPPIVASVHFNYRRFLMGSNQLNFHFSPSCTLLIAENIGNPDNLGMTLRTADAAGVSAVLLCGGGASPFHKNCIRAARGAVGRLPLFFEPDAVPALEALQQEGWRVLGATAHTETSLYSLEVEPPTAVVIGNEHTGISVPARESCTDLVRIPMAPGVLTAAGRSQSQASLNVGVAAGVLLYELVRR